MTREEQLACLKDRPCDVCKMRTDKGCSSWECVFEQTPDEEKEPCDCIIRANVEKIKEIMTDINGDSVYVARMKDIRALPSVQPTTKENLVVGDCISRKEVCDYIAEFVNHEYATDREREMIKHIIGGIQHLPSIQPTAKENLVVEDCISRAEAIKALNCKISGSIKSDIDLSKYKREFQEFANMILNAQEKAIQALPPVTPKPKTGHWIFDDKCREHGHCSLCGYGSVDLIDDEPHDFCRRCGAKMNKPQESEGKE